MGTMASSLTKCWNFRYTENNVKTSTKLASSHEVFHCSTAILLSCTVTEYAYFQDAEKVHFTGKRCRFRRNAFSLGSNVNCHLMKMGTSLTKMCKVKRWNKKEKTLVDVSCPAIVKEYNKYMGSVDLARMLRALYRIDHRIVNGWLQYKRDLKTSEAASGSQKDLMQFTLDVAEALTKVNKAYARKSCGSVSVAANIETSRSRVRRPEPRIAARFDQVAHWPEIINQKNRCRSCGKTSRVRCVKCNIHLCLTQQRNCFQQFLPAELRVSNTHSGDVHFF
ncbi:hypothetical protein T05_14538 [Trichinella murrelli]|uniref:PiggyBac transposable element-derived protein domain-containing protein n=1 Tax=Trichinella murrelli TaxID=144512 RepID=A0A0V0TX49_9BILA|nr:hypothetical protein T05_14538 [Trichinella murrelli]